MSVKSALVLGSTGAVGKHLLQHLLASGEFTRVGEYGRRVTPLADLPGKEELEQKVIDFDKVDGAVIRAGNWDVIFIT